jgi:DNA adenine methylase
MRYLGGKCRIAKEIAAVILAREPSRGAFIDAFVGGAAISAVLAPHFLFAMANDAHPDLIEMYRALQMGWVPPGEVSEQEYGALKHSPVSALRGFVGFGCSFAGKWFGGYARGSGDYAAATKRAVLRDIAKMGGVVFTQGSYLELRPPPGSVVYCDPPYASTTGYSVGAFDSALFWSTLRGWRTSGARVYVSEYSAPQDWTPVWVRERRQGLRSASRSEEVKTEMLYV